MRDGLLAGYSLTTWLYVIVQAANGLCIAFVLKYVDNLARVFASAAALVLTLLLSCLLFGAVVTPQLVLSTLLVAIALLQYSLTAAQLDDVATSLAGLAAPLRRCGPPFGAAEGASSSSPPRPNEPHTFDHGGGGGAAAGAGCGPPMAMAAADERTKLVSRA